jgi:hypothetical protein
MKYRNTKVLLLFSFLFFCYGLLSIYRELGIIIIPIVAIFIFLPIVLKIFFFDDLNFDFKGLKTSHRLNNLLDVLSEMFMVLIGLYLGYSAMLVYNVKDKENIANMLPYAFILLAILIYFMASMIVNRWKTFYGPILGVLIIGGYYLVLKNMNLT